LDFFSAEKSAELYASIGLNAILICNRKDAMKCNGFKRCSRKFTSLQERLSSGQCAFWQVRILPLNLKINAGYMAKDPTDYATLDFIPPVLHVSCGQVLMDRQRRIAIVAKKGRTCAHLVRVKSGVLKVTKLTDEELVDGWSESDCPFDRALGYLLELGRHYGMTDTARSALASLARTGREPRQQDFFGE
jgi:hypothetical protein